MPFILFAIILLFSFVTLRDVQLSRPARYEAPAVAEPEAEKSAEVKEEKKIKEEPAPSEEKHQEQKSEAVERELDRIVKEIADLKKSITSIPKLSVPPPPSPQVPAPFVKSEDIYKVAEQAMVNILCNDTARNSYILGSGAVIHEDGYVLTNAHIAENFGREGVECALRRGSPARPYAIAKIVLLPDQSIKIADTEISENDIAILKITSLVGGGALPLSFPHFTLDLLYRITEGETLYSLGYPTEFLKAQAIASNTTILFSLGVVDDLVSADDNLSDAEGAYLKGEASAQHGSSGGLFLEMKSGKAVGLFVGLTEGKTTAERKQFMFLASYIDEVVRKETGKGFLEYLSGRP